MNEREALLRAVCENPDEDTPRLVFADWLQENGDESDRARAEFIRVQIEQTTLTPQTVPWWKCHSRARKLFQAHGGRWCEETAPNRSFRWAEFVRGFGEGLTVQNFEAFEQHAEQVFLRTPLDTLYVLESLRLSDLCRVPRTLRLGILGVSAGETTLEQARRFLDALGGDGPTVLSFEDRIAYPEVEQLLRDHFGAWLFLHGEDDFPTF